MGTPYLLTSEISNDHWRRRTARCTHQIDDSENNGRVVWCQVLWILQIRAHRGAVESQRDCNYSDTNVRIASNKAHAKQQTSWQNVS